MSQSQLIIYSANNGVADNNTFFTPLCGNMIGTANGVEANIQTPIRDAGSFTNLYVRVPTNTASNTSTVTLRKSLADTAQTVSITGDATGVFEDTGESVAFAATDEGDYEIFVPTEAGANTCTISVIGIAFTPDTTTNTITYLETNGGNPGVSLTQASTTRYTTPIGFLSHNAAETHEVITARTAGTIRNFGVMISVNARTTDTTFRTRVNSANGASSVTYAGAETGLKEDAVNSDSLIAGDTYDYSMDTGTGAETMTIQNICSTWASTTGIYPLSNGQSLAQAFNVTNYMNAGRLDNPNTTEATAQIVPRVGLTITNLDVRVSANTIATDPTIVDIRDAGVSGNNSVSIAAATTGLTSDTGTDTITAATDALNLRAVTPNTSGSITFRHMTYWAQLAQDAPPAVSQVQQLLMLIGVGT